MFPNPVFLYVLLREDQYLRKCSYGIQRVWPALPWNIKLTTENFINLSQPTHITQLYVCHFFSLISTLTNFWWHSSAFLLCHYLLIFAPEQSFTWTKFYFVTQNPLSAKSVDSFFNCFCWKYTFYVAFLIWGSPTLFSLKNFRKHLFFFIFLIWQVF